MMRFLILLFVVNVFADPVPQRELTDSDFAAGINAFSLDFMKQMEFREKNVLYSPLGLSMAVGMILQASNNNSEDGFKMLHMSDVSNREMLHMKFKDLIKEYREMNTRNENKRNATIELANLLLYANNFDLNKDFVDSLRNNYEANVAKEDFATKGQEVMDKTNKFVKERTHELIPEIVHQQFDPSTLMVLINTIFFKGFWLTYFDKAMTENKTFTNIDKTEIMVPMMMRTDALLNHHHSEKHNAAIVELPYDGDVSMLIVLPDDKQGLTKLIENLNPNELNECVSKMKYSKVTITLPRFEFESAIRLMDVLVKMGMDVENSLTSLDPSLKITEAIHKAKIRVHETGTEAAAVTMIAVSRLNLVSDEIEPIIFNVDHPFAFVIRDKKSGINLFNGVLNKII